MMRKINRPASGQTACNRRIVMFLEESSMQPPPMVAIVIEPDPVLADTIHDRLASWGYQVATFATHQGAAYASELVDRVDVLVASVPASDEDRSGSYLEEAAARQGHPMAVVLILSDPAADRSGVPKDAVAIMKPFTCEELRSALERAETAVSNQTLRSWRGPLDTH
jgi:hypothetical protein